MNHSDGDWEEIEEMLRDEIAFRRLLVDESRDGIVVLTPDGRVHETNQRFADMIGYSVEETRKLHVWDWDFRNSKETLQEMVGTVDASGDHFETQHRRRDGTIYDVEISTNGTSYRGRKLIFCICRDITERKRLEKEREMLIARLQKALQEIKTLEGIIPICAGCKKIRNDTGYWEQVEAYVSKHTSAQFSHGLCPSCLKKLYPDYVGEEGETR